MKTVYLWYFNFWKKHRNVLVWSPMRVILVCLVPWSNSWSSYRNAALVAEEPSHGFFVFWVLLWGLGQRMLHKPHGKCWWIKPSLFLSPEKPIQKASGPHPFPLDLFFAEVSVTVPSGGLHPGPRAPFSCWGSEESEVGKRRNGAGQSVPVLDGNISATALLTCERGQQGWLQGAEAPAMATNPNVSWVNSG